MSMKVALFAICMATCPVPSMAAECATGRSAVAVGTIGGSAEQNTFAYSCGEQQVVAPERYRPGKGDPVAMVGTASGDPEKDTYAYRLQ